MGDLHTRTDRDTLYSPVYHTGDSGDDFHLPTFREPLLKPTKKLRLCIICFIVVFIFVIVVVMTVVFHENNSHQPVVEIDCFLVNGVKSKGSYVFKGIPYAEPPVENLRWKPPVPIKSGSPKCNNSTIDASQFGDMCYQPIWGNFSQYKGSEDCLYINVWTPTLDVSKKLPVMVWIHGGYLLMLDGGFPSYSPNEEVSTETNMVYVSMNYRLNAFGFMALNMLSAESEKKTSGNYGFRDQIVALEWVRRNIAMFGGDPNLVTLFGQSSGGTSVYALLASPKAKGLFQRAWMMSGSPILNKTLTEAENDNEKFLHNTKCINTTCLRGLSPKQVLDAVPWHEYPYWAMKDLFDLPSKGKFDGPLAIVDGEVITYVPITEWENGKQELNAPVIIGTTAQEVDLLPVPVDVRDWNVAMFKQYVGKRLGTFSQYYVNEALRLYPVTEDKMVEYVYTTMVTDARVTCATDKLGRAMANAAGNHSVYRYVVTAVPSQEVEYLGLPFRPKYAFHCIDSFAFFGTMKDFYQPITDDDRSFESVLRKKISNFARTGKVSSEEWKAFPSSTAIINTTITVVNQYEKERCDFWLGHGFFPYAWIN